MGCMKTITPYALRGAILVSAVSLCTALSAQTTTSAPGQRADTPAAERRAELAAETRAAANLSRGDRNFFEKAAKSGMKEVAVSRATLDRLTNPQVKQFAQMMVSDHSNANTELMALAQKKGVVLPPKDDQVKLTDKWSKKTDDVDEDYIEEMVDDHEEAVKLFEEASRSADADIAAFANKTLPKLRQHLTMAKDLEKLVD